MIHLTEADYTTMPWQGGTTKQLAIYPPKSSYDDRNFLWRVSVATIEQELSNFTSLPDYHRFTSAIEGELHIEHNQDGRTIVIAPYQVYSFFGGQETLSSEKGKHFNLMVHTGDCIGDLQYLSVKTKQKFNLERPIRQNRQVVVYCSWGAVTVENIELHQGETLLISQSLEELNLVGLGQLFIATVEW